MDPVTSIPQGNKPKALSQRLYLIGPCLLFWPSILPVWCVHWSGAATHVPSHCYCLWNLPARFSSLLFLRCLHRLQPTSFRSFVAGSFVPGRLPIPFLAPYPDLVLFRAPLPMTHTMYSLHIFFLAHFRRTEAWFCSLLCPQAQNKA